MARINLAGTWLWLWGLWHIAWLAGLVVVLAVFGMDVAYYWFVALYSVFLPLEIVGAIDDRRWWKPGRTSERARTLSQFRQWVAQQGKGSKWLGWKALAGGTGLVDATIVGYLVSRVNPVIGVVIGLTVALWLVPHFGWRERVG